MDEIRNELVWSHSRARAFAGCLRAYWYAYYGSWGGWDAEASQEARAAWVQKKLTTRAMWTGTLVHSAAEVGLRRALRGFREDLPAALEWVASTARADVEGSSSGAWLERPSRRTGFREHYYDEDVGDLGWDDAIAEILRQVRSLHGHRIYRRLLDVPERVVEIEELRRFAVGEAEVYAALDVLVSDGRGGVVIIDWKTGEDHDGAGVAAQLGVYGLYATQVLGAPVGGVIALQVNTRTGIETRHPIGAAEIAAARDTIASTHAAMRGRLRDPVANIAAIEDYPREPEGHPECRRCAWRRVCGREFRG